MFHHLKTALALTALCFSFSQVAQAQVCKEGDSVYPCGLTFTNIPTTPNPIEAGSATLVGPYTVTNEGSFAAKIDNIALNMTGGDTAGGTVTVDNSSSCEDGLQLISSASCDIYLSLAPSTAGLLDWNLTVTPLSTQRPLVLPITTDVVSPSSLTGAYVVNSAIAEGGTSSISHCPLGADGQFSGSCNPVTLTFASSTPLNNARNIVINSAQSVAYISNSGDGAGDNITICPIIDEETFGSGAGYCVNSASVFGGPVGLAFNATGSLLYIANSTDPSSPGSPGGGISKCPVNGDGSLGSCTFLDIGEATYGIAFNDVYTYAFVTLPDSGAIKIYAVDGSGNLTYDSDANLSSLGTVAPSGIRNLAAFSTLAFTNSTPLPVNDSVVTCGVSGNVLSGCDTPVSNASITNFATPAGFDVGVFTSGLGILTSNLVKISGDFVVSLCEQPSIETCTLMTDATFNSPSDVLILGVTP